VPEPTDDSTSVERPTTPGSAEVPDEVRIKRPTAVEVARAKAALAKFVDTTDAETRAVLKEFPTLVEVRVPRPNSAIVPGLAPQGDCATLGNLRQ
jgi:hypothetical protein